MKTISVIKTLALGICAAGLMACSSTRHGGAGGAGISDGGNGAGGAYAEGYGGGAGFQPSTSCNVPGNTQSYYFDFNSNDVHSEDVSRIQSAAPNLSGRHIEVVGNTDSRGSREY